MYTVLVADTNLLVRKGIAALLQIQENLQVIAEADSEAELRELLQQWQPDVVILDCTQPGLLGNAGLEELKKVAPRTRQLIITDDCSRELVQESLKAGATGFILKLCTEQEIVSAVHAATRGERYLCSTALEALLEHNVATAPADYSLTARETEIIQLIADGKSTKEIADKLFLSHHTINSHRKNILRKLQIKSPAELIVKALDLGIVKLHR